MVQLYIPLHTAAFNFKKRFLQAVLLLAVSCALQVKSHAQCTPPPAPVVIPNPAVVCINNGPVKLEVQPTALTGQYCSGPVNIAVPDNNVAGASNTIVVAGIPASCTVSYIAVTINMQHTRMGDMVFVLKAPNGQIINLDYRLSATGNNGATTGFANTVISSTGTAALSTGVNPYTATFKADAQTAASGSLGLPGPTGFQPTAVSWASLFTIQNGSWTLGFYDAATGETGTLNSWCLNFTYACSNIPAAAPAVWSPATGLYLDAACAVPYVPGTQTDIVYARPQPAGTYTYQVTHNSLTTPTCTSIATMVTVMAGVSGSIITQPVNQKICAGNNAQFSVATTGTGITYQWQVSTNGGLSYNNLVNSTPYSGVTTTTLSITQPTIAMSGLLYRVLTNSCGSTFSNAALLTVNPLPQVSFYAIPYTLLQAGQTTTLHAVVTPNPAATYNWWKDGAPLPGATADTLVVGFPDIGVYQVAVTDINGCSSISDTMSIRDWAHGRILIYPNPAGAQFKVRLYSETYPAAARTLIIYDIRGNKILTTSYTQNNSSQQVNVDLRKYGKGLYWVEAVDKDGKRISMAKVMVQ